MTTTTHEQDRDARHKARMQRKKALMDGKIAEAQDEYGLLLVHSGNGKGKSSSAFGMLARALGHGMQVAVVQFIKGAASTGEEAFFRRFPEQVRYHVMGEGFTWETQDRQRDIEKAQAAWLVARELLRDDIALVADARDLALATRRLLDSNFKLTVGLNSAILGAAAFGLSSPILTSLLHNGSTIAILLRALSGAGLPRATG